MRNYNIISIFIFGLLSGFTTLANDPTLESLIQSVKDNNTKSVQNFLRNKNYARKYTKQNHETALHIAAKHGNLKIAQILLDAGAKVNAKTWNNKCTPLHFAIASTNQNFSKIILEEKNASRLQELQNQDQPTQLQALLNATKLSMLLLERRANYNSQTYKNKYTPLILSVITGNTKISKILLKKGANPNTCTYDDHYTPLHFATLANNLAIVRLLLEKKAKPNAKTYKNQLYPLHFAVQNGDHEIVMVLLQNNADPNVQAYKEKITPLHLAVQNDHTDIVNTLLRYGAKPDLKTQKKSKQNLLVEQKTPIILTAMGSLLGTFIATPIAITLFITTGPLILPISPIIFLGGITIITGGSLVGGLGLTTAIASSDKLININKYYGNATTLHFAAKNNNEQIMFLLLENGANPNAKAYPNYKSPLHFAAMEGNTETIKLLLENNADIEAKSKIDTSNYDNRIITPLGYAAGYEYIKATKYLIKNGANIEIQKENYPAYFRSHHNNEGALSYIQECQNFTKLSTKQKIKKIQQSIQEDKKYLDCYLFFTILDIFESLFSGEATDNNFFKNIRQLHQISLNKITKQDIKETFGDINKDITKGGFTELLKHISSKNKNIKLNPNKKTKHEIKNHKLLAQLLIRFSTHYQDLQERVQFIKKTTPYILTTLCNIERKKE